MKKVAIIGGETHIGEITQLAGKELEIVGAVVREDQKEHAAKTYEACEVPRRTRFQVTAYVGRRGRVLSVSAVPDTIKADDRLECLLEQIKEWQLPRIQRRSKVTFTLRWQPPPPGRLRRRGHGRPARR